MRQNFNPLLEDYGVDLILSGHSHSYERSYLIDGHYGQSSTFGSSHLVDGGDGAETGDGAYAKGIGPHDGSVYVVAGSSGKTSSMVGHHPVMIRSTPTLGSMVLDVNGDNLDARFVTNNGNILDRFTITKDPNHQPPPSTSEEFIASADVYVRSNDTHDDGNTVNADGSDGGLELRGLFQWTPSGLPAGAQVTSASVKFSVVNPSGGSYDLYLVNNVWTEADVTWADATSLGAKVGTLSPSTTGTHTITLNAAGVQAVQGWVDGGSNNGLVLVTTGSTDGVDITSREGGSAAVLEVNFESGTAPTVPAAPSALAAAASGQNSIDLGWTDNADNETGFEVQRRVGSGAWATIATPGVDQTGYDDTGLTPETTYEYRAAAANSAGLSAWSNTISATTLAAPGTGEQVRPTANTVYMP